jgi:ferrochelatase
LPAAARDGAAILFTAHSVPAAMAATSGPVGGMYAVQLAATARLVADAVADEEGHIRSWSLAFQSRSGNPGTPWLEPDVNDELERLGATDCTAVVAVPIGFTSDHMEVVHDLDVEAAATARQSGLDFARATTPGTDPRYVAMVVELVRERLDPTAPRRALSALGPAHDVCPATCCPSQPARRLRG